MAGKEEICFLEGLGDFFLTVFRTLRPGRPQCTVQNANMLITKSADIRFEYNSIEQKCRFRKNVS